MPNNSQTPTVSFPLPVKNDAGEIITLRTVHIVVVKKQDSAEQKANSSQTIFLPLLGVFIGAVILIWVGTKIKPGKKTDRIINRFEGFSAFFGSDKEEHQ